MQFTQVYLTYWYVCTESPHMPQITHWKPNSNWTEKYPFLEKLCGCYRNVIIGKNHHVNFLVQNQGNQSSGKMRLSEFSLNIARLAHISTAGLSIKKHFILRNGHFWLLRQYFCNFKVSISGVSSLEIQLFCERIWCP